MARMTKQYSSVRCLKGSSARKEAVGEIRVRWAELVSFGVSITEGNVRAAGGRSLHSKGPEDLEDGRTPGRWRASTSANICLAKVITALVFLLFLEGIVLGNPSGMTVRG